MQTACQRKERVTVCLANAQKALEVEFGFQSFNLIKRRISYDEIPLHSL